MNRNKGAQIKRDLRIEIVGHSQRAVVQPHRAAGRVDVRVANQSGAVDNMHGQAAIRVLAGGGGADAPNHFGWNTVHCAVAGKEESGTSSPTRIIVSNGTPTASAA